MVGKAVFSCGRSGVKSDEERIRLCYEQHARGLVAYACSFLSEFAAAEDVLHQVFERLLRGDIPLHDPPVPYIYRAIRNASIDCLRRRSREVELGDDWLKSRVGSPEAAVLLQSALRQLPEEQREVVIMHVWGQLTFDEAGAALDISPKTAASRYRYGLTKLREQFAQPSIEDGKG
jgi:RNA polymerase sigma-70 factor (ECF subfamily)